MVAVPSTPPTPALCSGEGKRLRAAIVHFAHRPSRLLLTKTIELHKDDYYILLRESKRYYYILTRNRSTLRYINSDSIKPMRIVSEGTPQSNYIAKYQSVELDRARLLVVLLSV